MQKIISLFILLISFSAWAQRDSLGIFHRSDKVIIFVGEITGRQERMNQFMDAYGATNQVKIESVDQSVTLICTRIPEAASCNFSMLPSTFVVIGQKNVSVSLPANEMSLLPSQFFKFLFQSANGDFMEISFDERGLKLFARKRI